MTLTKYLFLLFVFASSCNSKSTYKSQNIEDQQSASNYNRESFYSTETLSQLLSLADSVIAFNYNGINGNSADVECDQIYQNSSTALCPSAQNRKKLDETDIYTLASILGDTTTYTGTRMGNSGTCFIPHAGFGFFKSDSLIAQVNICFLCAGVRTVPPVYSDQLSDSGSQRLVTLFKRLELKIVDGTSQLHY